jgi:hypothetical protein
MPRMVPSQSGLRTRLWLGPVILRETEITLHALNNSGQGRRRPFFRSDLPNLTPLISQFG